MNPHILALDIAGGSNHIQRKSACRVSINFHKNLMSAHDV
jgi:hypothetical protein